MNKFLKYWTPIIFWMIVIFALSSIPNLKTNLKEDYILRKIAHIFEFAILTWLLCRAISNSSVSAQGRSASGGKMLIFSVIFSVFYALTDEYHQTLVLNRHGTLKDVGIDSIGIFIVGLIWYIKSRKGRLLKLGQLE